MNRRRLLAAVGSGLLAGCVAAPLASEPATGTASTEPDGRLAEHGFPPEVCAEEPKADPGVYAVTDPAFGDGWGRPVENRYLAPGESGDGGGGTDDTENGLADGQTVVGLASERPRAYPVSVLWYHEIVNDRATVDGRERPIIVTYCSRCHSGMVAERVVDGRTAVFTATGLLWAPPRLRSEVAAEADRVFGATRFDGETAVRSTGNLVMADDVTGSYWSQLLGRAICGPKAGERLSVLPATVTTWREWRRTHPETDVLLPPPYSATDRAD